MQPEEIAALCTQALEAMRNCLPAHLYREARELIEHNEYGVAMEFVIDWIDELDLEVTPEQMRSIETAMVAMAQ